MDRNILTVLPTEIIVIILKYTNKSDLLQLRLTCTHLRSIIDTLWENLTRSDTALVTNQINSNFQKRCKNSLNSFNKHRISNNWIIGKFNKKHLKISAKVNMPRIILEKDYVWVSYENIVAQFERDNEIIQTKTRKEIYSKVITSDVSEFRVHNNKIISANRQGIWLYSLDESKFLYNLHINELDITCIDIDNDIFIIGSKENEFRVYTDGLTCTPRVKWQEKIDNSILSIAINKSKFALGSNAFKSKDSIKIFDGNKETQITSLSSEKYGAGILTLKWENDNTIWSCGHDTSVRKWDLRINKCVQTWWDPFDSTIYTMDLDYANTFLTGCSRHGRIVLWDTRKSNYVQLYFTQRKSSPIYGLAFDAESFFATTERHLNTFNFTDCDGEVKSFSNLFQSKIVITL